MRVLMISKALVVGIYQRKLETIAAQGIDLTALVPASWQDASGTIPLERLHTHGYDLRVDDIRFNGNFHLHYYPSLPKLMREIKPDIVHIDEEPYNFATWHALYWAKRNGAKTLFFSWQNILRRYPPPFSWGEAWALRNIDFAIMGTDSAADVWREKGYAGEFETIQQFGVDPELFKPSEHAQRHPVIGYIGRLVPEKGVDLLIRALAAIRAAGNDDFSCQVIGGGVERDSLEALARDLGIHDKVSFIGQVPSAQMPKLYQQLDILVIPSRTRPNWKEQFGRVIIEAMSSGVAVIGSDSAAIPDVIGSAGLIFKEESVISLQNCLTQLISHREERLRFAQLGRARVLERFTVDQVAKQTVDVYHKVMRK